MRFDNQIKCNGAQELVDEAGNLLATKEYNSNEVSGLIKRIGVQVDILADYVTHAPREDQFAIRQVIFDLSKQDELLKGLVDKKNKKKSKK